MAHRYEVTLQPRQHLLQVRLQIAAPDPDGQILALPAWVPGSYTVRNLARHIVQLTAHSAGKVLAVEKIDKDRWRLAPCSAPLQVEYNVYAFDKSVRTAYLDDSGGFFNGPAIFLRVVGQEAEEHELRISGPDDWQLATSMARQSGAAWSWGIFSAEDYRGFCNHPLLCGLLARVDFSAGEIPHHLALHGHPEATLLRLGEDLSAICAYQQAFWGESPFSRYHFLCLGSQNGYGGLEHQASSALLCKRTDLDGSDPSGYRDFLGLASHEYFHSWLVQGIRPAVWSEGYWEGENASRDLWIFEGITSYYDSLLLCRAGLWSADEYLQELGREITRLARRPGEALQSLAESSADAWTKLYHPHPGAANFEISYYNKGALAALCLDARLRAHGSDLDQILRMLWQDYRQRPLPEGEIFSWLADKIPAATLAELRSWIFETHPLPLTECLEYLGVALCWRAAAGAADRGGVAAEGQRLALGATWKKAALGVELTFVRSGSPAEAAGLCPGDRLLTLDAEEIHSDALQAQLDRVGSPVPRVLHYLRDGRLYSCTCTPAPAPLDTAYLLPLEDTDASQRRARWLTPEQAQTAG
ncbi:M61 family peptidase [Candidatus Igneacidithiobacillus taiwanensis]|uniref:M61 family metallopeptidase n=1 Tax=Candidatus Igneacidithiobacillus taiwanensis TaxID=1945924 RepID=UPI0028990036|nr:M61 family peptidase [Candidatus Igneacidithiobacillus taiwanensis]